ncbi:unnamed protein product [Malus baccata var. baccata]
MEIPVLNIITDLPSRLTSLPDPSFLWQSLSFPGIQNVSQAYSLWTWGALVLAILASFGTLIAIINIFVIGLRRLRILDPQPLNQQLHDGEYSDVSDDDDICSASSASSLSDEDLEPEISFDDESNSIGRDEQFHVKGSGYYGDDGVQNRNFGLLRRRSFGGHRFSWSDFTAGNSVVKLWDASSPATFLSADPAPSGLVSLGVWDARVGCRIPAILAEWGPQIGRIVGVASGGVEKVYVKDGVTGHLTVGDVRKVASPLGSVTEADVDDTRWDADAVVVTDESAVSGCDSAVIRCCSAVRSYLL